MNTSKRVDSCHEDDILVCCARSKVDSVNAGRVRKLLQKGLDWKYLLEAGAAHGVMPLLSQNLTKVCPEYIPKSVGDQLKRYLQAHTLNNLFLTRELMRLLDGLEKIGISAIPWKGPLLAATAYGSIALRQFGDLDILTRERDSKSAKEMLLSSGYRLLYQGSAKQEKAFHSARKVCELVSENGRVMVELHWAITSRTFPFALDPASLWTKTETVLLEGVRIRNLSAEDLLLVLSVHGAKHHWGKLMWICDIAEVVRSYADKIDWDRLMAQARTLGVARILCLALFLARDLLEAEIPEKMWRQVMSERKVGWLAGQVRSNLFSGGTLMAVERPRFYIHLRERTQDRMRCRVYLGYRKMAPRAQAWALRFAHSSRSARHFWRHW